MADRLKEILQKILDWWNRFTSKQKTIIVSIAAGVVFTFAIIIFVFSRPNYEQLVTCDNSAEAAEIVSILESAGIEHKVSDNGLVIQVEKSQRSLAILAMGSAGYVPDTFKLSNYMDYSMTTTASDRERMYKEAREAELEMAFCKIEGVKDATVIMDLGPQNGTLIAQETQSTALVQLTLANNANFSSGNAAAIARATAAALGKDTTAGITILDQRGELLFAGGDDFSSAGIANSIQELQNQAEAMLNSQVTRVIYGTGQYDNITVAARLDVDYTEFERTIKEYSAPEGRDEGLVVHDATFESSSTNGVNGVPGTDSNDSDIGTGYVYPDNSYSESEQTESERDLVVNEKAEYQKSVAGSINYANSSISIALISYREYNEDRVRRQGLLTDGMTWEDFKDANDADIRLDVDEEYYAMVANATGISADRITIIAYETPIFNDAEGFSMSGTDILSIVMIILIIALLAFVVLRTMRTKKGDEEEEELSVESMLQSTADNGIEEIDVETKSDTRLLIEKFVDENPEAVANLLRNWLNEDWG